jgi:hypothetical protein
MRRWCAAGTATATTVLREGDGQSMSKSRGYCILAVLEQAIIFIVKFGFIL